MIPYAIIYFNCLGQAMACARDHQAITWTTDDWWAHPSEISVNTLRPRQNGRHFGNDTFKYLFVNKNVRIVIKISLKFVLKGPVNNIPVLVQIMAWRRPGDKTLSEPMMVSLLTHICVTQPQWVNRNFGCSLKNIFEENFVPSFHLFYLGRNELKSIWQALSVFLASVYSSR